MTETSMQEYTEKKFKGVPVRKIQVIGGQKRAKGARR